MSNGVQQLLDLQGEDAEYSAFVEKFKPKKTTDDCLTPPAVYDAVADWVASEYGLDRSTFVRPFWPGGDFERFDYPDGCTVVDNPPFSILSGIVRWFNSHGVHYFLFAPTLTNLSTRDAPCHVLVDGSVTYENGAVVATSFVTDLDQEHVAVSSPSLYQAVKAANDANMATVKRQQAKYEYPDCILTAAALGRLAKYGQELKVRRRDCCRVDAMDAQASCGKSIYGSGLLLSERAAAERAAAERAAAERAAAERAAATRWELSEREKALRAMLGGGAHV